MIMNPPDGVDLEDRPCPNGCAGPDLFVLEGHDRIHGIPGRYRVVRCATCLLMRTNPRPTPATIGVYYPDNYGPYASTVPAPAHAPRGKPLWHRMLRNLLGLEVRRMPTMRPGRLLEIGCASGSFLQQMRSAGWSVEGIEFSDAAAAQARSAGLRVQTATVESAAPPGEPVDVIAAWMVLEHLHDPTGALRRIREWVRADGWLVASIPDADTLARRVFGERAYDLHLPNHLYHFTPSTIDALLRRSGWRLQRVRWQKNCNNLLWSLEYWATETRHPRLARAVRWARAAPGAGKLRVALAWLLGVTRQSGRIEIWARPVAAQPER
jgi:SAM-dependent methyltransferase